MNKRLTATLTRSNADGTTVEERNITLDVSASNPKQWVVSQDGIVDRAQFATHGIQEPYTEGVREFYACLREHQSRGLQVASCNDAVAKHLREDAISQIKPRLQVLGGNDLSTPYGLAMQFVPAGRRMLIVVDAASPQQEPYGVDVDGVRQALPAGQIPQWCRAASALDDSGKASYDVYEGVLVDDQLVLTDLHIRGGYCFAQHSVATRITELANLLRQHPSPAVRLALTHVGDAKSDLSAEDIRRHATTHRGALAVCVPWGKSIGSPIDQWLMFDVTQILDARVAGQLGEYGLLPIELRGPLGTWRAAGTAKPGRKAPSIGEVVQVRYAAVNSMDGSLVGAEIMESPAVA